LEAVEEAPSAEPVEGVDEPGIIERAKDALGLGATEEIADVPAEAEDTATDPAADEAPADAETEEGRRAAIRENMSTNNEKKCRAKSG
jgi:hypothetical protein